MLVLLFLEHPGISVFGLIDNFAQEDELTENPRVGGSIPPLATIIHKAFSFLVVSIFSFGEHMVNIISPPVPLNILQKKSLFPAQGLAVLGAGQVAQPRCRY